MYGTTHRKAAALAVAAAVSLGVSFTGGCQDKNKDMPHDSTPHSDGTPHKPGDSHPDHGNVGGSGARPTTTGSGQ